MNSVGQAAAEYPPTDDLQALANPDQLPHPGRCSGEAAMDFQPAGDTFNLHRPLVSFSDLDRLFQLFDWPNLNQK